MLDVLVGYVVPFAIALSTGTHTYWLPFSSSITKPSSILFIVSDVPTLKPAGIVASFPVESLNFFVSIYMSENVSKSVTVTVI